MGLITHATRHRKMYSERGRYVIYIYIISVGRFVYGKTIQKIRMPKCMGGIHAPPTHTPSSSLINVATLIKTLHT